MDRIGLIVGLVCLLVISLREITFTKNLIKKYFLLFRGQNLVDSMKNSYDTCAWKYFYGGLLSAVVFVMAGHVIIRVYCRFKDRKLEYTNDLERRLFAYLDSTSQPGKCFAILGEWGAGKTHLLNNALDRYMSYKFHPCYRISCFGLSEREEILDALKRECRQQDTSIMKTMINWIQYLPALGPWLSSALEKKYELGDLSKKSVFVFEDFERIASNEEDREEKYNLIVGFINEIIERYHYKTIIVCNHREMKELYNELLHKKLDCEEYKLPSQTGEVFEIARREIYSDNRLSGDEKYELLLTVEHEIVRVVQIFKEAGMINLRKLVRVFRALTIYEGAVRHGDRDKNREQDRYYLECMLYSALYREILEEEEINLTRQYSASSGRLFFDVYTEMLENYPDKDNVVLKSLLNAPAGLVYIAFEPEKMSSSVRLLLERKIAAEKEKAETFARWVEAEELNTQEVEYIIYHSYYGLMLLAKCLIFMAYRGEGARKLFNHYLGFLETIIVSRIEQHVNVEYILRYLYDLKLYTHEIEEEYRLVVEVFLKILHGQFGRMEKSGQELYDIISGWYPIHKGGE